MTSPSYYPEDHENVDYLTVTGAEDLRPFLAHVLDRLTDDPQTFLTDLARLAGGMITDRARHSLTGPQWVLLETARYEGSVTVTPSDRADADALAAAGLATVTPVERGKVTVTPTGQP
jgi:hypothetical protein